MSIKRERWVVSIPEDDRVNAANLGTIARQRGTSIGALIRDAVIQVYSDELALTKDFSAKYPYADTAEGTA